MTSPRRPGSVLRDSLVSASGFHDPFLGSNPCLFPPILIFVLFPLTSLRPWRSIPVSFTAQLSLFGIFAALYCISFHPTTWSLLFKSA